jgi:hypothetical protein
LPPMPLLKGLPLLFRYLCPTLLLALLLCPVGYAMQLPASQVVTGEALAFDIAFLWFDRLAEGRLTLSPGERPNTYKAVLEARTLGVAAWLTRERRHLYVTLMEMGEDRRFQALSHESFVSKWKGDAPQQRTKRYVFDHDKQQVHYQRIRNGAMVHDDLLPMGEYGPGIDILTISYNFRAGLYGPLRPGAHFRIPAFNHKGVGYITIDILTDQQRQTQTFFPKKGGLLCKIQVDPEIFDTGNGILHVWLDEQGRPARSIVEKVVGIGTVRGTMR